MSLWNRALTALGVRKSTGEIAVEGERVVLRELARAKALPQEPTQPGREEMTECERCARPLRQVVFTTAGGGEQLEIWRAYPLAVDGWVCASCGWAAVPRHIRLEESLEYGRQGVEHAASGQLDDAEFWFRRIIGSWPSYPPGYADLGQLSIARAEAATSVEAKQRYRREAESWLRRAIDGDPERRLAVARVPFARMLALNGNEPEASQVLASLIADAAIAASLRGEAEQLAADIRAGKALFSRATELGQDSVLEPTAKSLSAANRKALERAAELLCEARERAKTFATCWYLGKTELRLGRMAAATAALEEAHRLNPEQPDGCRELCNVYLELGRAEDALPVARRALELRPNDAGLRSNLALVCLLTGDVATAQREVRAALAAEPADTVTRGLAKMIEDVAAGRRACPRSLAAAEGRER